MSEPRLTYAAKEVVQLAGEETRCRDQQYIHPGHVLLGFIPRMRGTGELAETDLNTIQQLVETSLTELAAKQVARGAHGAGKAREERATIFMFFSAIQDEEGNSVEQPVPLDSVRSDGSLTPFAEETRATLEAARNRVRQEGRVYVEDYDVLLSVLEEPSVNEFLVRGGVDIERLRNDVVPRLQ